MYIELDLPEHEINGLSIQSFYEDGVKYQRLVRDGLLLMTNTPNIVEGFTEFLGLADGSILINGLGIGMCCQYLLSKPEVTDITVIEYEEDIVNLVAPHFRTDPRCEIILGDAFTYDPPSGKQYDYVWHDVWLQITTGNLDEMAQLFKKYESISKWQGAWSQDKCIELKRQQDAILAQYDAV